jgi:hypothetical protein
MNPDERAVLENFLDQLVRIRGAWKIREAEAMIRRAVDRQSDAAYLLAQRSLMLEQALERTKARLARYELAKEQGSFLDANASSARTPTLQTMATPSAADRSQAFPPFSVSALSSPRPGVGSPSFFGRAAATAAGIAGQVFLVQGLEDVIDDHIEDDQYARLI